MSAILLRLATALWVCLSIARVDAAETAPDRFAPVELSRRLACLQAAVPASLPVSAPGDGPARMLRVRLVFKTGEAEPAVDWLWKGDEGAAAQLERELRGYRMPCLEPAKGSQAVLQEFWWEPSTGKLEAGEVLPTATPGELDASCYDGPRSPLELRDEATEVSKVLVFFRFYKDGNEPEVEIAHRVGSPSVASDVRRYVRRYKPCSGGRTSLDTWHEQIFRFFPRGTTPPKSGPFNLNDFLRQVRGAESLHAHFDMNTMNCPFRVKLQLYQPARHNVAMSVGRPDPNRSAFLAWLERLQLDLSTATEAALFAETLMIDVPCQSLGLKGQG